MCIFIWRFMGWGGGGICFYQLLGDQDSIHSLYVAILNIRGNIIHSPYYCCGSHWLP